MRTLIYGRQPVREVLRAWYDRRADRITESALAQLHQRRGDLVRWVRDEVAPARRKAQEALAQRRADADRARSEVSRLQGVKRDHERARRALMVLERGA